MLESCLESVHFVLDKKELAIGIARADGNVLAIGSQRRDVIGVMVQLTVLRGDAAIHPVLKKKESALTQRIFFSF